MSKRQLRQPEKALGADLATEISRACTALETAIELSQEPPPEHLQASKGWLAGNALWMRALSNCEVTLFLVEKGMDGPAWSNSPRRDVKDHSPKRERIVHDATNGFR